MDAREFLANAIVQVVAQTAVFAFTHLHEFPLQMLAGRGLLLQVVVDAAKGRRASEDDFLERLLVME